MAEDQDQDPSSKTEEPSQRKLEDARKRGQVPLSREVSTWLMLVTSTLVVGAMIPSVFVQMAQDMIPYMEQSYNLPTGPGGIAQVLSTSFWTVLTVLLPVFLVLMAGAFFGPFAQVGPLWAPELIKPALQKISLMKGLERLFSVKSVLEFVKGLIKITVVSIVTYFILRPYIPTVDHFVGLDFALLMGELGAMTTRLLTAICVVMMVFAGLDLTYQRFDFYQRQRMTKDEVKDEYRQTEGDPVIKGRLKQLRMERARRRMMQNVPTADVVITNPTHFAVALQYIPEEMAAPKVVAKGADFVAARIRELARANNVEIVENPPLARALYDKVDLDQTIPMDLYKAVAEVITYVFKKTGKMRR